MSRALFMRPQAHATSAPLVSRALSHPASILGVDTVYKLIELALELCATDGAMN